MQKRIQAQGKSRRMVQPLTRAARRGTHGLRPEARSHMACQTFDVAFATGCCGRRRAATRRARPAARRGSYGHMATHPHG